ncbi:unnamed protein product [Prunus armeniaca]|uniref:Uncharacterized protein n=1 Tax=Prunus armeniaca TaxID=36596 RepID=A0A6J5UDZ3_PRUAR|nr:unnamed protein product [Prunus armeniaca]
MEEAHGGLDCSLHFGLWKRSVAARINNLDEMVNLAVSEVKAEELLDVNGINPPFPRVPPRASTSALEL